MGVFPADLLDAQVDPARPLNIIYTYYKSLGGRTREERRFFVFFTGST
jgi:hypothetical protein